MKPFYIFLFLIPFGVINAQMDISHISQSKQGGAAQENKLSEVVPCQCYCSDLCGPRDRKEDDAPFLDSKTGEYFCKQRDKDNYFPNQCNIKNPNPVMENPCITQ